MNKSYSITYKLAAMITFKVTDSNESEAIKNVQEYLENLSIFNLEHHAIEDCDIGYYELVESEEIK